MAKHFLKLLMAIVIILFTCNKGITQNFSNPSIEWQKCIGGSNNEDAYSIIQTFDGGYITVGWTSSTDFDAIGNHGSSDLLIVKLSNVGAIEWNKCIGGSRGELLPKIIQNNKGGYIISAITTSNYRDVSGNPNAILNFDGLVIELDSVGNIIWQKCYGGSDDDYLNSIIQTPDEGYLFVGTTSSIDGDLQNLNFTPFNIGWIVKIDSIGNIEFQKLIGGSGYEDLLSISLTSDFGFIVGGYSTSNDGDVQGNIWYETSWIIKFNNLGYIQWQKCIGSENYSQAKDVKQCSNGGYIVACEKRVNFLEGTYKEGYVVKLSSTGTIEWQKDLGGNRDNFLTSIYESQDGGYIVGGFTESCDGDIPLPCYGFEDYWLLKLTSIGNIEWQKRFGGNSHDRMYSLVQTVDNGYILAGGSSSNSNDVIGLHTIGSYPYYSDMWIVKLSPTVSTELFEKIESFQIYPNPTNSILNLNVSSDLLNETYQVVNVFGQFVVSEIIVSENTPLNVSQLPKGIYLLQIGNSKTNTQKFIKN